MTFTLCTSYRKDYWLRACYFYIISYYIYPNGNKIEKYVSVRRTTGCQITNNQLQSVTCYLKIRFHNTKMQQECQKDGFF